MRSSVMCVPWFVFTIFLSCSVVILAIFFKHSHRHEDLASNKTRFHPQLFFLNVLYQISNMAVLIKSSSVSMYVCVRFFFAVEVVSMYMYSSKSDCGSFILILNPDFFFLIYIWHLNSGISLLLLFVILKYFKFFIWQGYGFFLKQRTTPSLLS